MKHIRRNLLILVLILSFCISTVCEASVSKSPKLNVRSLYITRDTSYKLRVYNTQEDYTVSFESDDTSIVSIKKVNGASCSLKPRSSGVTTVTANVYDDNEKLVISLRCSVTVSPPAVSIKFNKKKYKLRIGKSKKIKAIVKPNISNEKPMYISDNPEIATVSSTGTVTAVAPGLTKIRAIISNGKESSYMLKVTEPLPATIETPVPTEEADTQPATPMPTRKPKVTDYSKHDFVTEALITDTDNQEALPESDSMSKLAMDND